VTPEVLQAVNQARADKKRVALIKQFATGREVLIVDGEVMIGSATSGEREAAADCLRRDQSRKLELDGNALFVQVFNPPLRLAVVGAVHISQALAPMAALAGYHVTVIDPRGAFATLERFPDVQLIDEWPDEALEALAPDRRTAVVTLTHDPKLDDPALDVALKSQAFYVAALGSRRTHAGRRERLAARGHDDAALARIHGPAGLDIGAVSPAEIAVSVMAEMTAALRKPATADTI